MTNIKQVVYKNVQTDIEVNEFKAHVLDLAYFRAAKKGNFKILERIRVRSDYARNNISRQESFYMGFTMGAKLLR